MDTGTQGVLDIENLEDFAGYGVRRAFVTNYQDEETSPVVDLSVHPDQGVLF